MNLPRQHSDWIECLSVGRVLSAILHDRGWKFYRGMAFAREDWEPGWEEWKSPDGAVLDLIEIVTWLKKHEGWAFKFLDEEPNLSADDDRLILELLAHNILHPDVSNRHIFNALARNEWICVNPSRLSGEVRFWKHSLRKTLFSDWDAAALTTRWLRQRHRD